MERAEVRSPLAVARSLERAPRELAVADLKVKGRSEEGVMFELPVPFDPGTTPATRPRLLGPGGQGVSGAEWLGADQAFELAEERFRDRFPRFPRPRTPEGEVGVLIRADCSVDLPMRRTGGPAWVSLGARFLGNWDPRTLPTLVFSVDGEEVHRIQAGNELALTSFELPAAFGRQDLHLEIRDVVDGPDSPKLVLHTVLVRDPDGLDHVFLPAGTDPSGLTARFLVKLPEGVQVLRAPSRAPEPAISARVQGMRGPAAVQSSIPQPLEILDGEGRLLGRGTGPEIQFEFDRDGLVELQVRGTTGPLRGSLLLLQPRSVFAGDLPMTRGADEPAERHPLVTHVQAGHDTRRSLLLVPGSEVVFDLPPAGPARLRFDHAAFALAPRLLSADVCPPPRLEILAGTADELQPVATLAGPFGEPWESREVAVPGGVSRLVFRCPDATGTLAASLALLAVAQPRLVTDTPHPGPNLLVYLIDTLRADHLSCYGHDRATSPNIDALAQDGVLFEQAYSQAPWTRPSVATLLTGLLYSFHGAGKTTGLAPELDTLTEVVHAGGYQSAAFIANAQIHGMGLNFVQGFNRFVAVEDVVGESRASDVNRLVLPWLEQHADEPFFLYVHTIDPHAKYEPPPETAGTYNKGYQGKLNPRLTGSRSLEEQLPLDAADLQYIRDLYDEEILFNDREFGRLVAQLKQHGLYENTVIVVVSDHGEEFGEHGGFGHGGRLWQELLHVPLVVKLAGEGRPRGVRVPGPVRMMDVFPTAVTALGLPLPVGLCQGTDLSPWWQGNAPEVPLDVIAEEQPAMRCLIRGDFKVIQEDYDRRSEALRLYHLTEDPGEQNDLAPAQPELAQRYLTHLLGILASYREAGFESVGEVLELELTDENLEALRAMGYIE